MKDIAEMQQDAENRHNDVLDMIESLSDTSGSDGASSVCGYLFLAFNNNFLPR
jgi:hypothetical protein